MPAKRKIEEEINTISQTTGGTYTRLSEARTALHGYLGLANSRGGKYDELQCLRITLDDDVSATQDLKLSDAWIHWEAYWDNSGHAGKRFDQARRIFHEGGSYA